MFGITGHAHEATGWCAGVSDTYNTIQYHTIYTLPWGLWRPRPSTFCSFRRRSIAHGSRSAESRRRPSRTPVVWVSIVKGKCSAGIRHHHHHLKQKYGCHYTKSMFQRNPLYTPGGRLCQARLEPSRHRPTPQQEQARACSDHVLHACECSSIITTYLHSFKQRNLFANSIQRQKANKPRAKRAEAVPRERARRNIADCE